MPLIQLEGRGTGGGIGQRQRRKAQRLYLGVKISLRRQVGVGLGQSLIITQQGAGGAGTDAHKCSAPVHRANQFIAEACKQYLGIMLYLNSG